MRRRTGVSVPSSSGNSLQQTSSRLSTRSTGSFSPLFIGELSSTPYAAGAVIVDQKFQSPLHRGTLFNLWVQGYKCALRLVSVPSSSGNSLQQVKSQAIAGNCQGFSPLFIGELSSTSTSADSPPPTHRFSPLFIGELSSTVLGEAIPISRRTFQSPLHRGTLFNPIQVQCVCAHPRVSVPSSSGNSLQRRQLGFSFAATLRFSPLFIGELSSTSLLLREDFPSLEFQSPLHRGTLFNHHGE